ncbi:hypothetical protein Bca101_099961 [Brassica carinata]
MKTDGGAITVFQLMIPFLLVAISVVAGQKETVLDSRGNPEKANARYWRVEDSSKAVVLNGSKSSNDSTFTIQKFGKSYKLAFGSADKPTDVGLERIRIEDYRLILSNNSGFAVAFARALF